MDEQRPEMRRRASRSDEDVPAPCEVCVGTGKIRHEAWSNVAMDYYVSYSTCTGGCVNGAVMVPVDDETRAIAGDLMHLLAEVDRYYVKIVNLITLLCECHLALKLYGEDAGKPDPLLPAIEAAMESKP